MSNFKTFWKGIWKDYLSSAILTLIAGILVTVFHSVALDVVCIGLGLAGVILGLMNVIRYLRHPLMPRRYVLLTGLIFCSVGVMVILHPQVLEDFVAVIFGIVVLFHGIINLQNMLALKKSGYRYWPAALVIAILTLLLGITLIILKRFAMQSITLVVGIMLIVDGLMDLWMAVKVKKLYE